MFIQPCLGVIEIQITTLLLLISAYLKLKRIRNNLWVFIHTDQPNPTKPQYKLGVRCLSGRT